MNIVVTEEERATLEKLVSTALQEIRVEVRHTHDSEAREELKKRESVFRRIGEKLEVGAPAVVDI